VNPPRLNALGAVDVVCGAYEIKKESEIAMKQKLSCIILFVLCVSIAVPALASSETHPISDSQNGSGLMSISNFVEEHIFWNDETSPENMLFDTLVIASAPATVTLLVDGIRGTGSQSSGSPGSRIYKIDVSLTGYESFIEWERGISTPDELSSRWVEVPLSSGKRILETGEDCFEVLITPAGSTYVLEEGTYVVPSNWGHFDHCFVILGESASLPTPTPPTPPTEALTVSPSQQPMYIDGSLIEFDAYLINNQNYVKLRDFAFAIMDSQKSFSAGFDVNSDTGIITAYLTRGGQYEPIDQEMIPGDGLPKEAKPSDKMVFYIDGENVSIAAYMIGDNNYLRVRDMLELFDICAAFDTATQTVTLDTTRPFAESTI